MERRDFVKAAGGIGTGAVAGGVGLFALSGGASATANSSYNDVTITSDDGTVEYVALYGATRVEWDGFENVATAFRIVNEARIPGQVGWTQLNSTGTVDLSQGSSWGGAGEDLSGEGTSGYIDSDIGIDDNGNYDPMLDWHVVGTDPDDYGLPNNSLDAAALEADSDGATENFTLELRATYTWFASGDVEFEKTFTSSLDVEVNNEAKSASASSSGSGAVGE